MGFDPQGIRDRYTNYFDNKPQSRSHRPGLLVRRIPGTSKAMGPDDWGLTASDDQLGYLAHFPTRRPTMARSLRREPFLRFLTRLSLDGRLEVFSIES